MSRRTLDLNDTLYDYLLANSLREHPAQTALREATRSHPWAGMQISPEQGQLMALLVKLIGAKNAIEIGVFTGYSALTVALALPADGHLLACDISDEYTRIGRPFWQQAGVAQEDRPAAGAGDRDTRRAPGGGRRRRVRLRIHRRRQDRLRRVLRTLPATAPGRADLIAIDNVLWNGSVAKPAETDDTRALQALNRKLHRDERIDVALLPIGDGLTLARKR
jgi:caffeoyl-CoA O-methyltransferase